MSAIVLRYSASTSVDLSSAATGVVFGADFLDQREMLAIAHDIGCERTAFVLHAPTELGDDGLRLRYFDTAGELPFDASATVAAATALAQKRYDGSLTFAVSAGAARTTTVARAGRHVTQLYPPVSSGSPASEPLSGYATRVLQGSYEEVLPQ